jgi:hypothetical protein
MLLAIGVVSVAAIFVAMIRYAPRDNECDGHHFEEHRRPNDFEIEYYPAHQVGGEWWKVQQRVVCRCAHEGCSETETGYEKVAATEYPLEAIEAMKENAE